MFFYDFIRDSTEHHLKIRVNLCIQTSQFTQKKKINNTICLHCDNVGNMNLVYFYSFSLSELRIDPDIVMYEARR